MSLFSSKLLGDKYSLPKEFFFFPLRKSVDFPGGTVDKNPAANEGDMSLIPGPGRSHVPHSD